MSGGGLTQPAAGVWVGTGVGLGSVADWIATAGVGVALGEPRSAGGSGQNDHHHGDGAQRKVLNLILRTRCLAMTPRQPEDALGGSLLRTGRRPPDYTRLGRFGGAYRLGLRHALLLWMGHSCQPPHEVSASPNTIETSGEALSVTEPDPERLRFDDVRCTGRI